MTGIAARGHSLRTLLELSVSAIGVALGGPAGTGTAAYTVCIGPLTHVLLPRPTATTSTQQEGNNHHD